MRLLVYVLGVCFLSLNYFKLKSALDPVSLVVTCFFFLTGVAAAATWIHGRIASPAGSGADDRGD